MNSPSALATNPCAVCANSADSDLTDLTALFAQRLTIKIDLDRSLISGEE